MAVTRRARRLRRRQLALVSIGGAVFVGFASVGAWAVFGDDEPAPVATEVQGAVEANPDATSTTATTTAPASDPVVVPPVTQAPPPAPPPAPTTATLTVDVTVPPGFTITGCTVGGVPAGTGPTLVVAGLAPGPVAVVCDAQTGDGAARAGRVSVVLVAGDNRTTLQL